MESAEALCKLLEFVKHCLWCWPNIWQTYWPIDVALFTIIDVRLSNIGNLVWSTLSITNRDCDTAVGFMFVMFNQHCLSILSFWANVYITLNVTYVIRHCNMIIWNVTDVRESFVLYSYHYWICTNLNICWRILKWNMVCGDYLYRIMRWMWNHLCRKVHLYIIILTGTSFKRMFSKHNFVLFLCKTTSTFPLHFNGAFYCNIIDIWKSGYLFEIEHSNLSPHAMYHC